MIKSLDFTGLKSEDILNSKSPDDSFKNEHLNLYDLKTLPPRFHQ